MMYLYHYTTRNGIEGIYKNKKILKGKFLNSNGTVKEDSAISLTTDLDPSGHGLPDGRAITEQQAIRLKYVTKDEFETYHCLDHTEFRLKIDASRIDVISATDYYKNNQKTLIILAIGGYYPVSEWRDNPKILKEYELKLSQGFLGKSSTWWYCFQEIPLSCVLTVSYLSMEGNYEECSLQKLEALLKRQ